MQTIDSVADVCNRRERLESVQEPRRDVEMPKVVVVQQECLLLAKGRRISSDVDKNVVNRTMLP
jgi:TPP-dependent indolepyruvate ferredoxin oxidoreductase alpha subunit